MGNIPVIICCGSYPRQAVQETGASCPVCGTPGAVDVVETWETCCLCFLPLPCVPCGGSQFMARCRSCGSVMPRGVLLPPVATVEDTLERRSRGGATGVATPVEAFPGPGRALSVGGAVVPGAVQVSREAPT